jgi:hypothetical protein
VPQAGLLGRCYCWALPCYQDLRLPLLWCWALEEASVLVVAQLQALRALLVRPLTCLPWHQVEAGEGSGWGPALEQATAQLVLTT